MRKTTTTTAEQNRNEDAECAGETGNYLRPKITKSMHVLTHGHHGVEH